MNEMLNRSVLITGTSKGLGYALAEAYLKAGYKVFGISRRSEEGLFSNFKLKDQYQHVGLDLSDAHAIEQVYEICISNCIDILILNAADYSVCNQDDSDALSKQLSLNMNFPVLLIQKLISNSKGAERKIVFISSIMAELTDYYNPFYGTTKKAVSTYIDSIRFRIPSEISILKVTAGPLRTSTGFFQRLGIRTSVSYSVAAKLIIDEIPLREREIFVARIWGLILFLFKVIGMKRMSYVMNQLRKNERK